jgi:hypothetical protein
MNPFGAFPPTRDAQAANRVNDARFPSSFYLFLHWPFSHTGAWRGHGVGNEQNCGPGLQLLVSHIALAAKHSFLSIPVVNLTSTQSVSRSHATLSGTGHGFPLQTANTGAEYNSNEMPPIPIKTLEVKYCINTIK